MYGHASFSDGEYLPVLHHMTAEATAVDPINTQAIETAAESLPKQETGLFFSLSRIIYFCCFLFKTLIHGSFAQCDLC